MSSSDKPVEKKSEEKKDEEITTLDNNDDLLIAKMNTVTVEDDPEDDVVDNKDDTEEKEKTSHENASHETTPRMRYLNTLTAKAFSYIQTHVLTNPKMLSKLQTRLKLFKKKTERGSWFIIMTPLSAVRFIDAVDQYLVRTEIHKCMYANNTPIFDWGGCTFFSTLESLQKYSELSALVGEVKTKEQEHLRKTLMKNYEIYDAMHTADMKYMFGTMMDCDVEKQVSVTLMCVDKKHNLSGCESFMLNINSIIDDEFAHLRRMALQYFVDIRASEVSMCVSLGGDNEELKPLSKKESDALRNISYQYASGVIYINDIETDFENITPMTMKESIDLENAPCGYCSKVHATVRCRKCHLFRYCDDKCMKLHKDQGVLGAKEGLIKGQHTVTHMDTCIMTRGLTRLWAQMPSHIKKETFDKILQEARTRFMTLMGDESLTTVTLEEKE
jgi:hypothetical protein